MEVFIILAFTDVVATTQHALLLPDSNATRSVKENKILKLIIPNSIKLKNITSSKFVENHQENQTNTNTSDNSDLFHFHQMEFDENGIELITSNKINVTDHSSIPIHLKRSLKSRSTISSKSRLIILSKSRVRRSESLFSKPVIPTEITSKKKELTDRAESSIRADDAMSKEFFDCIKTTYSWKAMCKCCVRA